MEEKAAVDLSSISLEDLVREVKARMKSYESARQELGFRETSGLDSVRAEAPARRGRKAGPKTSNKRARRTDEMIVKLLKDQISNGWTNAELAKHAGVSTPLVSI